MRDDFRNAFRSLRSAPAFTAVALVVLTLGIGAGTAVFSIVDAVVLRGLPFDEHDRLVAVLEHDTRRPETFGAGRTTPQTYLDWRRLQESFDAVAGVGNEGALRMRSESGEPVEAQGLRLTHEFFTVFRVTPIIGRAFTAEDEIDGRHRVAILSHGIYGVMAYTVAQRTGEIGVRMALGATRGDVMSMVLKRASLMMAAGLAIGATAAWFASSVVRAFLFETEPNDVRVLAGAVVVLAAAGLLASAIPARRAASVDPLVARRDE